MRTHGTLVKWNDERGFGFIVPAQGEDELFVHVSAFRRGGARPALNELVSFEVRIKADGRKEAVNVMRAGDFTARDASRHGSAHAAARQRTARAAQGRRSGLLSSVLSLAAIAAIAWYGYERYSATVDAGAFDASSFDSARTDSGRSSSGRSYSESFDADRPDRFSAQPASPVVPRASAAPAPRPGFVCDGRRHCSQMNSCEEARFFLRHCPGTEMDGDHDGLPCEREC